MQFFRTVLLCLAASAAAFRVPAHPAARAAPLHAEAAAEPPSEPEPPKYPTLNGWTYDPNAFAGGLPGALDPMGDFDPAGFLDGVSLSELKRIREAEVTHGRVAMLAVVGYLVGEAVAPLLGNNFVTPIPIIGMANTHLAQLPATSFATLTFFIAIQELNRALTGWVKPQDGLFMLREDYYPGDVGFDPLGLKPAGAAEFAEMQTKELQNGRLAMLAAAGFCAQEQVDGMGIMEHFTTKGFGQ